MHFNQILIWLVLHYPSKFWGKLGVVAPTDSDASKTYDEIYKKSSVMANSFHITTLRSGRYIDPETEDLIRGFYRINSNVFLRNIYISNEKVRREYLVMPILDHEYDIVEVNFTQNKFKVDDNPKRDMRNINLQAVQVIIGTHPEMFLEYLNSIKFRNFSSKDQSLCVLLLSSKYINTPRVYQLLIFLWKRFSILNVMAQSPYATENKDSIFIYKPFRKSQHGYGQIHIHNFLNVLTNPELLRNHVSNLNGYPIRLSLFERFPTSTKSAPWFLRDTKMYSDIPKTSRFYGSDGMAMETLSEIMNFTIHVSSDSASQSHGKALTNGTVTGSLGQVVDGKVDLQGNSRFVTSYGTSDFQFTSYYSFDKMCIVVPKAEVVPKWLKTFKLFRGQLTLLILITVLMCSILNKVLRKHTIPLLDATFEMYTILLCQPNDCSLKKDKPLSRRIFLGSFFMFTIVISTIFAGALLSVMSTKSYLPDINTLMQFDKSGMIIKSSFNPFEGNPSQIYQKLSKKVRKKMDKTDANLSSIEIAAISKIGGIERYQDSTLLIKTQFSDKDGNPLLHIVNDCPNAYFLAYIVPVGSPYLEVINKFILMFHKAGLVDKWSTDLSMAVIYESWIKHLGEESRYQTSKFTVEDSKSIFFVLFVGYITALMVFYLEICYN